MAIYSSSDDAINRQRVYPALDKDLVDHDFQRRRVSSCVRFISAGDIVLDVACNTGYFRYYVPSTVEIHGIDVNPAHIDIAATRLASAQVASAESMPFPDQSFDVVNLSGLLEQVYDPVPVISEAARVCRRYLIGNTTHADGTWGKHRIESHEWQSRSYTRGEITDLLSAVGTIVCLDTVKVGDEPQCWYWCVDVRGKR